MDKRSAHQPLLSADPFSSWLNEVQTGQPRRFGALTVLPLHAPVRAEREYLLLGEALAQQVIRITEVSQGGLVPELLAVNTGARPVLLMDGEELLGAKQNRVLNLSVLVPAYTQLVIPVSCVEQGRWHHASVAFRESGHVLFARARAHKSRDVTNSMAAGDRSADQAAVWRAVAAKLDELRASSPTQAMHDAYEQRAQALGEYLDALERTEAESGAIFALRGVPVALELFDCADAFRVALPKLICSYALDALRLSAAQSSPPIDGESAAALLERIGRVRPVRHRAIGLGEDLRAATEDGMTGGALLLHDRLVHISVFDAPALERVLG
jgi:hypothetical protein